MKRVVNNNSDTNTNDIDQEEMALVCYLQQPNFNRGIIQGFMYFKRRKIVI